jgi:hypothetical protein
MKFYNVCIDEDSHAIIDNGDDITKYNYRGYISENGMCGCVELTDLQQNFNEIVNDDSFLQEDEEGQQELEKLNNGFNELLKLYNEFGGVLLTWAVEYDQNWLLIYDTTEEEVVNWLNRIVDKSEFDE